LVTVVKLTQNLDQDGALNPAAIHLHQQGFGGLVPNVADVTMAIDYQPSTPAHCIEVIYDSALKAVTGRPPRPSSSQD
jgi:hypothetical protein